MKIIIAILVLIGVLYFFEVSEKKGWLKRKTTYSYRKVFKCYIYINILVIIICIVLYFFTLSLEFVLSIGIFLFVCATASFINNILWQYQRKRNGGEKE